MCEFGKLWSYNSGERCTHVISFFKVNLSDNLSHDPPDRFLPHFHHMVGIWSRWLLIWPSLWPLKGCCHGNQFLKGKIGEFGLYSPLIVALAFQNGLHCCHSDLEKFICDDLATLCRNLVNFGPVTPEFTKVKAVHPSFFYLPFRQIISGITIFLPFGRYLIIDY